MLFKRQRRKDKNKIRAGIVSVGKYMPPKILTNADLEKMVDTSDEWIIERTGIRERRIVSNGETQSDLAMKASREALARAGWEANDLDMIVVGTVTPDHIFPSSANTLAAKLGAIGCPSFDVLAACSGFMYALFQGITAVESGWADKVLVVGSEVMSSIVNWDDRSTCVLFGDGAGAVLLEGVPYPYGVQELEIGSDGRYDKLLHMPAGGSVLPPSAWTVKNNMHCVHMEGQETFKVAVRTMSDVSLDLMERAGIRPRDLSLFIGHQANIRILDAVAKRMKLRPNQVYNNIQKYGNTTSATIPSCLYDAESEGMLRKGDWLIMVSFGAGLTWGGALLKWAVNKLPVVPSAEDKDLITARYSDGLKPGKDWVRP